MWAEVGGEKLGTVGTITGPYNTGLSTLDRTINLDTQADGQAVFFGYVANKVRLSRTANGGKPVQYDFGSFDREMTGGGWTRHGDLSGKHTYQPSWMVLQTSLVTRVYSCQPHPGGEGDFRMSGGQGAQWSTSKTPWINDVKFFDGTQLRMEVSGYGVVWQGVNYNFVSLISVTEKWPCEMMRDFSLPTGFMSVSEGKNDNIQLTWSANWGCRSGQMPNPDNNNDTPKNRGPIVSLKANPERGDVALTTTFTASASDPEGDAIEYRFLKPDGKWTPWGPEKSITVTLSNPGKHTARVEVSDIHGTKGNTASATVTAIDPVWDVLVLYRRNNDRWDSIASKVAADKIKEGRSLVTGGKEEEQRGFMKGTASLLSNWAFDNGALYNRLVRQVQTHQDEDKKGWKNSVDAVVIATRIDSVTGRRIFEAGLWRGFADPRVANSPFTAIVTEKNGRQVTHLDKRSGVWGSGTWGTDFKNANDNLENRYQRGARTITVNGREMAINVVGYQNYASPVILDLAGLGVPDLLAGPDSWKKGRDGKAVESALREFNLDGTGSKLWEWVGPNAGILVWGGDQSGPVSSERLFGNHTWGRSWQDGYEPLAVLDVDGDGWLSGDELKNLHIWVDENSNAINEKGEIKTLAELGITQIAVKPERDDSGNAWADQGYQMENGKILPSWDWWSLQGDESYAVPSIYHWEPIDEGSGIAGGFFVFTESEQGDLTLVSMVPVEGTFEEGEGAVIGVPFVVERDGRRMKWRARSGDTVTITDAVLENGNLIGVTKQVQNGEIISSYGWGGVWGEGPKL